jgi:hypothetical protein
MIFKALCENGIFTGFKDKIPVVKFAAEVCEQKELLKGSTAVFTANG